MQLRTYYATVNTRDDSKWDLLQRNALKKTDFSPSMSHHSAELLYTQLYVSCAMPCLVLIPWMFRAVLLSLWNIRPGLAAHPEFPLFVHCATSISPECGPHLNSMSEPLYSVYWLPAQGWTWLFWRVTFLEGLTRQARWLGTRKLVPDSVRSCAAVNFL